MSQPKSHHYVPRFYLAHFSDAREQIWVFDKAEKRSFRTNTRNVACVRNFYELPELEAFGLDPLTMEYQFSSLEAEMSQILKNWVVQLDHGDTLVIPDVNREIVSQFIALQLLRTVEARTLILQLCSKLDLHIEERSASNRKEHSTSFHSVFLWNEELIERTSDAIGERAWILGRNNCRTLFQTSDHPVLIKSGDNTGWVLDKSALNFLVGKDAFDPEDYIVYPLTPRLVMYCYDRGHYEGLDRLDGHVTPVEFTSDMVNHENSGQVGASNRFIFSLDGDFSYAEQYLAEQPWISDSSRDRFAAHSDPYDRTESDSAE